MRKIGLLSDSHGAVVRTRQAVALLQDKGAQVLIHLGDFESPSVLDELLVNGPDGQPLPVHVVFGNVDWDTQTLEHHAETLGIHVHHPVGQLELTDGGIVVFTHGHIERFQEIALTHKARYFCHGHTHVQRDQRLGETRLINPGALHRASRYTVALLDTLDDHLAFYPVNIR